MRRQIFRNKHKLALLLLLSLSPLAQADAGGLGPAVAGVFTAANFMVIAGHAIGLALFIYGLCAFYFRADQPVQYPLSYCTSNVLAGVLLLISSTVYAWSVNSLSSVNWATDSTMLAVGSHVEIDGGGSGGFLTKYLPPQSVATLLGFIYLVGLYYFLKGIYLFRTIGSADRSQAGGFSTGFAHFWGGIACMNILTVGCYISYLLNISMLCAR